MKTLTILHTDPLLPERNLERYLLAQTQWQFTRLSTASGGTKPFYLSVFGSPRVLPDEWTDADIKAFHSLWPQLLLSSFELPDADYAQHISRLQSRSLDKTRPLARQR